MLDFIAPFGDALRIGEDLKNTVFAENMGRYLRVKKGSDTMKISYIHGVKRLKDAADYTQNPTVELKHNAH
jgi:cytolysin-activating lysine-acyltransferase